MALPAGLGWLRADVPTESALKYRCKLRGAAVRLGSQSGGRVSRPSALFHVSSVEVPSGRCSQSGWVVRCNQISSQVYTVGPDYAHAEARKSPALDGKVERDSEGKEIRYPVMLTAMEKLVARKVCVAFKVCVSGLWAGSV